MSVEKWYEAQKKKKNKKESSQVESWYNSYKKEKGAKTRKQQLSFRTEDWFKSTADYFSIGADKDEYTTDYFSQRGSRATELRKLGQSLWKEIESSSDYDDDTKKKLKSYFDSADSNFSRYESYYSQNPFALKYSNMSLPDIADQKSLAISAALLNGDFTPNMQYLPINGKNNVFEANDATAEIEGLAAVEAYLQSQDEAFTSPRTAREKALSLQLEAQHAQNGINKATGKKINAEENQRMADYLNKYADDVEARAESYWKDANYDQKMSLLTGIGTKNRNHYYSVGYHDLNREGANWDYDEVKLQEYYENVFAESPHRVPKDTTSGKLTDTAMWQLELDESNDSDKLVRIYRDTVTSDSFKEWYNKNRYADKNTTSDKFVGAVWQYFRPDEMLVYKYLSEQKNKGMFETYKKLLEPVLTQRSENAVTEDIEGLATEYPFAMSLGSGFVKFAGGITSLPEMLENTIEGKPTDAGSTGFASSSLASGIRNTVKDEYTSKWFDGEKLPVLDNMGNWIYDTLMSMEDSVISMAFGGALGKAVGGYSASTEAINKIASVTTSAIMGSQVASDSFVQGKIEGYTNEKALSLAVIRATIEGLTEKYSVETILNADGNLLKRMAKSSLAEGSEEVASNWLNAVVDVLADGENVITDNLKEYKKSNPNASQGEALSNAILMSLGEDIGTFLAGAVSGAGMSVFSSGNNSSTGLTATEEKVVKKLYEEVLAERQKDGTKLSKSEQKKLYESIVTDMDNGQIKVDDIERILGGESYKTYQDYLKDEVALPKEYEELENKENYTIKDWIRYHKLGPKIKEIKEGTKKLELKHQLSHEVLDIVRSDKTGRLMESYREVARKKEAFKADLTQYKGKQKEAVQRAVDSGVLNNTYRSHELVNLLSKIEADKGIVFDYSNNAKIKESGFAVEGKNVTAYKNGNKVTLNIQSSKAWQSAVGHEITHVLEGTDAYAELQHALYSYAERKGEYKSRRAKITELYKGMNADVDSELTADLVGEYLFGDEDFVKHLTTNRNLFQRIYDEIKYLYKVATGKEQKEIARAKRMFDKAWKELSVKPAESGQKNNTADNSGVKYSFGGTKADNAPSLYLKAERMAENGVDNETIRQETGWFKGYDDMWRFEIDDSEMKVALNGKYSRDPQIRRYTELTDKVYFQNDYTQSEFDELQELDKKLENKSVEPKKLGDLIEHKKLFEAYPQLQEISVVYESGMGNTRGAYDAVFNEIVLNNNLRFNPEQFKKTLVHEIQHAIQHIEGFAYGSSPEYWESAKHRYTAKEKEQSEQLKRDIYNMERDVKKEFGSEAWKNIVKYKTLEEIYFEEDIDTESLEKQLEDIENEAKEQGYNEWINKYYYAKSDLDSIDRRVEKRKHRGNEELYLNTAGEIEARDVSNRVDLTEEQRKNTQPDIKRMGVVFSDYGLSMNYLEEDEALFNPDKLTFDSILKDVLKTAKEEDSRYIYLGRFPAEIVEKIKKYYDIKDLPVVMNYRDTYLAMEAKENGRFKAQGVNYHNLGDTGLTELKNNFANPDYVIKHKSSDKIELIYPQLDYKKRTVYCIVILNTDTKHSKEKLDVHVMTTAYGKAKIEKYVETAIVEDRLIYSKEESLESDSYVRYEGYAKSDSSSTNRITLNEANVNKKYSFEIDEEYLSAVESGEVETAQMLVDEAAESAMKDSKIRDESGKLRKVYHGSDSADFYEFDKQRRGQTDSSMYGRGYYFAFDSDYASDFGENIREFYLDIKNPYYIDINAPASKIANFLESKGVKVDFDYSNMISHFFAKNFGSQKFADTLVDLGFDGVIVRTDEGDYFEAVAFHQNQMKLADPITYDNDGNVIPLSERFNKEKTDVRYSVSDKIDDIAPVRSFGIPLNELYYDDIAPVRKDITSAKATALSENKTAPQLDDIAPVLVKPTKAKATLSDDDIAPTVANNAITAPIRDDLALVKDGVNSKVFISMEEFANNDASLWNNVEYNDQATKSKIMRETHNAMIAEGAVIKISDDTLKKVAESFPDLRTMKKKDRTQLLKDSMNKLKNNLRTFLSKFKGHSFEFEVNGKVLEARLYNTGINEVLEKVTQEKSSMLYSTEKIFQNSRYMYSTIDYDGDPNVYRWNYFYTPVQIGEGTVGVRIAVRDLAKQGESQIYHWGIKKDTSLDGVRDDSNNRKSYGVSSDVSNNIIPKDNEGVKKKAITAPVQTVEQKVADNLKAVEDELQDAIQMKKDVEYYYNQQIYSVKKKIDYYKNQNIIWSPDKNQSIPELEKLKAQTVESLSAKISELEKKAKYMKTKAYNRALHKQVKMQEHAQWAEDLIGDTTTWKDKKLGLQYQTNTEFRNLRDNVRDANGKKDIAKADAISDALNGQYNREEAAKKREQAQIVKKYAVMNITKAESTYIQMLGELRHNPKTSLSEKDVNAFYEKHKKQINKNKVDRAIDYARKDYDSLILRLNEKLREQGMREIPYRQGYFPHFTEPKQNFIKKLLNWKTQNTEIPTSIAGLTESFKPVKKYQSFDKQRHTDTTDYNFLQGFDNYLDGALDWIYHLDTLQKRRAVENYIRYVHSDKGIQARIREVYANEELDADETQAQVDHIFAEGKNPLNNFVQDFTTRTNILAGKKNSLDRTIEQATNRHIYSVMTNVQNRMSANMVLANIRSAMTNYIPITQSWAQVSPLESLKAAKDTIANAIKDDGMIEKSTFLTNRLREVDRLYQTNWDKVLDKAGIMFEIVDNFSSQVIWRSKYNQNIKRGMTESEAIRNADQFAENVMAGRSKGNEPTLFNAKNPLVKAFTMFQLEVNNQYGYLFKDVPIDLKAETNHWKLNLAKGYTTAFVGAFVYNVLMEMITGSDAAFDPLGIIWELLKDLGVRDEDEKKEPDEIAINLIDNVVEELPFVGGLFGGGRVPISSAMPYSDEYDEGLSGFISDVSEGEWGNVGKEMLNPLLNVVLPVGGGQIKKTAQGLRMFKTDEEHPIAGSYTDKGKLRFPVEDTPINRIQAALFGQYASENARNYFDKGYKPLTDKQLMTYVAMNAPIDDFRKYQKEINDFEADKDKNGESISGSKKEKVIEYINNLDIEDEAKYILIKSEYPAEREHDEDIVNYINSREDLSDEYKNTIFAGLGITTDDELYPDWVTRG